MTRDVLARCSRADLERLMRGYWDIMTTYENVCGGPGRASEYREYLIVRQSMNMVRPLLGELAD